MNELNTHTAESLLPVPLRRFATLLAAIAGGIALFGFVVGLREPHRTTRAVQERPQLLANAPTAVSYSELAAASIRPNAQWQQALSQLKFDRPDIFAPVVRTDAMKTTALMDRTKNRAYDGAPPTIPHPTQAQSTESCLACHREGLVVGGRIASKMSHTLLSNCTQCHVEQESVPVENDFVGLQRAGPGDRASPGAPPTIPHHTWMRENCNSCHGLVTRAGTRTTHPWLTNCSQCHANSAALDQVEFLGMSK